MATKTTKTNEMNNNQPINGGGWSSIKSSGVPMYYIHVEIEFLEKALGTSPNNADILKEYIASKAPDAKTMEEEIAAIGQDAVIDKQVNVYPKGQFAYDENHDRYIDVFDTLHEVDTSDMKIVDNVPFYYNYQIRGFFKDSCGLLSKAEETDENGKKLGATESAKIKAYKKVIDGGIFVFPRRIAIDIPHGYFADDGVTYVTSRDENGNLRVLSRPIRISGATGERTAIASSEVIPAGSRIKFTIGMTSLKFKPAVIEWLNYACVHGISGWRNSGLGICRWREIKDDYTPYEVDAE